MNDAAVAMNIKLIAIIGEGIGTLKKPASRPESSADLVLVICSSRSAVRRWSRSASSSRPPDVSRATFRRQKSYMRSERLR